MMLGCAGATRVEIAVPAERTLEVVPGRRALEAARLGLAPEHLPPPGQCRIWRPGAPPVAQDPPGRCGPLAERVPAGGWLVHRSRFDPSRVDVTLYAQDVARPHRVLPLVAPASR